MQGCACVQLLQSGWVKQSPGLLVALVVAGNGGDVRVDVYDAFDVDEGTGTVLMTLVVGDAAGGTVCFTPSQPVVFSNLYLAVAGGAGTPYLTAVYI